MSLLLKAGKASGHAEGRHQSQSTYSIPRHRSVFIAEVPAAISEYFLNELTKHTLLVTHNMGGRGSFRNFCGTHGFQVCTVNATGETLVLNKNFPNRKQGFPKHQGGKVGIISVLK